MTAPAPWRAVAIGWALAALVLLAVSVLAILQFGLPDPDDTLRLLEVRDWLAGQSWWDVRQHRLAAGDMHWSRLVDLPLAAVMLLARPLLGTAGAEMAALIVVPLATLFAVLALGMLITWRVAGGTVARQAVLLAPLSVPLVYQLRPLRIDHHGWQIVLAMAALYLLLGRATLRNGALLGLSLAALVMISLEGLPVAAALTGLAALAWALDPARRPALLGTVWGLALGAGALQLATRGLGYAAPMCDAITPDWLLVFGVGAAGVSLATLVQRAGVAVRLGALAAAGAAALAVLLRAAPECVGGPFAQLEPLVRTYWYEKVSEGLPLWEQTPGWAAMTIGLPITGLIGSVLALRGAEGEARARWGFVLAALIAATALALLVQRSGATANAFALPGAAWAVQAMLVRARAISSTALRVPALAGALLAGSPGLAAVALFGLPQTEVSRAAQARAVSTGRPACIDGSEARIVGSVLPPSRLFLPLDIAPDVIRATPHSGIASGHHRNHAAMRDVISAFLGTPENARRLMARTRAAYLVVCPGMNEPELYRATSPHGFWARLDAGERFDWLEPVAVPGSPVRVWHIRQAPLAGAGGARVKP